MVVLVGICGTIEGYINVSGGGVNEPLLTGIVVVTLVAVAVVGSCCSGVVKFTGWVTG